MRTEISLPLPRCPNPYYSFSLNFVSICWLAFLLPCAQFAIHASVTRLAKNSAYRAVHLQLVIMCVSQRAMCCKFKETSALTVDSSGIDLAVGNMERIKEQPSALRPRSTNKYTKAAVPSVYQYSRTPIIRTN